MGANPTRRSLAPPPLTAGSHLTSAPSVDFCLLYHRSAPEEAQNTHTTIPQVHRAWALQMAPKIEYYCPCTAESPHPPPPPLPSSSYSFHPLHNLFFCEECDAVRCNRCVLVEVSGYYCPNCLFEVPSASVRAEKNRCVFVVHDQPHYSDSFKKMCTQLLHVSELPKYAHRSAIGSARQR